MARSCVKRSDARTPGLSRTPDPFPDCTSHDTVASYPHSPPAVLRLGAHYFVFSVWAATLRQTQDPHRLVRWVNQADRLRVKAHKKPSLCPGRRQKRRPGQRKKGGVSCSLWPANLSSPSRRGWMGSLKDCDDNSYVYTTPPKWRCLSIGGAELHRSSPSPPSLPEHARIGDIIVLCCCPWPFPKGCRR